ncbi:MAG: hypothetical protein IID14_08025 [Candidatus Marinimicrobia bacterium]|nr:hypothetical protein [Candidatus Neomarinimicrobiota bacterium]
MITEPTLFILGAGASAPYGFPTAEGLRNQILTRPEHDLLGVAAGLDKFVDENVTSNFIETFQRADSYIDHFISRSKRKQFKRLGKISIALKILAAEEKHRDSRDTNYDGDWVRYLYHEHMVKGFTTSELPPVSENKIKFITFNYDRLLEYYLYIVSVFGFDSSHYTELIAELEKIGIIHVYGSLGPLAWQGRNRGSAPPYDLKSTLYGYRRAPVDYQYMANNIEVMHESRDNQEEMKEKIQRMIDWASRIFFLGFSYDPENMKNIGFPYTDHDVPVAKIYGTTKGLGESFRSGLREQYFPTHIEPKYSSQEIESREANLFLEPVDSRILLEKYL